MGQLIFKNLAEEWLQNQKNLVKESTYCTYTIQIQNHIIPLFGNMECNKLTSDIVRNTMLHWLGNNRLRGNMPLSDKTVYDIIVILKSCLKYGAQKGYLTLEKINIVFPAARNKNKSVQIYNHEEQKVITDAVLSNLSSQSNGILLSLYTGIRIGELCALKWSDINLENQTITISKTLQRLYFKDSQGKSYTKIRITSPKTSNSIREIPISARLTQAMRKLCRSNPEAYILTNSQKYMEPRTYRNFYSQFISNLNIRKLKFHSLRHTFATRCIEYGADYKSVSEILGHSNVNITMNLYVHPSIEQKRKCIELMEHLS